MEILKTRKFKLSSVTDDQTDQIEQIFSGRDGIKEVQFNSNNKVLKMTYNLESIMLKKIEQLLYNEGIHIDAGFGQKIKRNWQHFTEQNELDNLHVSPTCCTNPKTPETQDRV